MSSRHRTLLSRCQPGFTLLELLVVVGVIAVLLALLLPTLRTSRDAARRMACGNNLKQLGLALHNYHDAYQHLPSAMGGTGQVGNPWMGNANRLSGLVALLPFVEQQALWEQISMPLSDDGVVYPEMGPAPWIAEYPPWQANLATFRCPSTSAEKAALGRTNYAFCIGDVTQGIHQPKRHRGAFACGMTTTFADIKDGTTNVIAMAEMGTAVKPRPRQVSANRSCVDQFAINQGTQMLSHPSLCDALRDPSQPQSYKKSVELDEWGRGSRWADGAAGFSLFNTVLPPNSPSCAVGGAHAVDGIYSAGSYHPGGSQVVLVDGSVRFIAETIDAGDPRLPPVNPQEQDFAGTPVASPYGTWGMLGTADAEGGPVIID